ncbi:hypothetical protein VTO73DRAFT_15464 [Trametes versicolor]
MFSFISNKSSTCAECRSLGSGKSKSKLDKKTIGRPREYEWPAFQPQVPAKPKHVVIPLSQETIDELVRKGLGTQLISLQDARMREELVRGTLYYHL